MRNNWTYERDIGHYDGDDKVELAYLLHKRYIAEDNAQVMKQNLS
jgi:hypothetical protein